MKSDLDMLRHARSAKDFPEIGLEEDEFVELAIHRSPVYVILIWAGELLVAIFLLVILMLLFTGSMDYFFPVDANGKSFIYLLTYIIAGVVLIGGLVTTHVHRNNKLFVTNRRLIQLEMKSLFAKSTNVIDLISIEDASFKQSGIFEYILKTGTLRMSTVGDETTYTFKYMDIPTNELEIISHLVHVEKDRRKKG